MSRNRVEHELKREKTISTDRPSTRNRREKSVRILSESVKKFKPNPVLKKFTF